MKESALQSKAIALLRSRGPHWFVEKRHAAGMGVNGLPDLACVCWGLSAQLELKTPRNKPTQLQEHRMQQLRDAGAIVDWTDSLEGVARFAEWCEMHARRLGLDQPGA